MSTCKKSGVLILITVIFFCAAAAGKTGLKEIYTIQVSDLDGNNAWLPFIGEYPLIVVYEDFRNVGERQDIYLETLKKPEFYEKIKLVYVSNTEPAWFTPDFLIYHYFRERKELYSRISIFIDRGRNLQKKWRLPDSDNKTVIILISREGEIIDLKFEIPEKGEVNKFLDKMLNLVDF